MRKRNLKGDSIAIPGPLDSQIASSNNVKQSKTLKRKLEKNEAPTSLIHPKLTKKILKSARSQKIENEDAEDAEDDDDDDDDDGEAFTASRSRVLGSEDEDSDLEEESEEHDDEPPSATAKIPENVDTFNMEDIKSLISDKRTEIEAELTDIGSTCSELSDELKEHYLIAKKWLHSYRSGAIPKAIKCLPTNRLWEEIMELLEPEKFTAAAVCALTFYFAKASVGRNAAQAFYRGYLLPRVRDDIAEYRRLNFHLARAIQHALFQPAAFTTGFLLPLCRSGASLSEASIIGGLLRKYSIPVKYAAVMLSLLVGLPYSGGTAVLMRCLLEKKYNFPVKVVELALQRPDTFFTGGDNQIDDSSDTCPHTRPVLWHQALLSLVQRYSAGFNSDHRKVVLALCRKHHHPEISPEIRRALRSHEERGGKQKEEELSARGVQEYEKEEDEDLEEQ